jgi:hypothetical protein
MDSLSFTSRKLLSLVALTLICALSFAVLAPAVGAATGRAHAPASIDATKKKKKKKRKLCVVRKKVRGKFKIVYVKKRVTVKVKKNGKTIKVKKVKKVPKKAPCKKKKSTTIYGTPITVVLAPDSVGHLDFSAFVRDAPLTGSLKGYVVGGVQLNKPITVILTSGKINIEPTPVFIDDNCGGDVTASIRTGPTYATLDTSKSNTAALVNNTVTSVVHLKLRTTIELRDGDNGCNQPYLQTGYTEMNITQNLFGKLASGAGGLALKLSSAPQLLEDFSICLALGDPGNPCNGFQVPFPFLFGASVDGLLKIGKAGNITVPKTTTSAARR